MARQQSTGPIDDGFDDALHRVLRDVHQLVALWSPSEGKPAPASGCAPRAAWLLHIHSNIRRRLDADLFADPAYDILLHLLASEEQHRPVAVSDCAHVAGIAPTTSLRWVALLEQRGLIMRRRDEHDGRRILLNLTERSRTALTAYLRALPSSTGERPS